jgi:hypothetical protein
MDIVKKFLKSNWKSSVEAAFRNIVITNNFVVLSLPSYINFYGVPTPTANDENNGDEGPILSNGLFGIFKEVDYQESRSKVVCLYNPPSSEHVGKTANTEKNLFGYNLFSICKLFKISGFSIESIPISTKQFSL